ncbi:hypothetical protein [Bacillus shivajii]|nr:hypothetical protein [Bacillus shivajii]
MEMDSDPSLNHYGTVSNQGRCTTRKKKRKNPFLPPVVVMM